MIIVLVVAALAVIAGLLRGGSLSALADTTFRWGWLIFVGLALQLAFDLWDPEWLTRTQARLTALALGLIIGGAIGNAIDRLVYGAVADFVLLSITTASSRFDWYVFNLADAAIVAGVVGLLYESVIGDRAAKAP